MRPIIGILTQPYQSDSSPYSYIAASYVKYLESAGARVVPIFHNSTKAQLQSLFNQINGILFPGGGSDLNGTTVYQAGEFLYKLALDANNRGIHFPIMGHCMGFELLAMISSRDMDILEREEADDISMPLNFTAAARQSRMFADAPQWLMDIFATKPVTMNFHHWGVGVKRWYQNQNLADFYDVLSVNDDIHGSTFISTVEAKKYPIYGLQWHPEKNGFEWNAASHINHSPEAIHAMQYMADFTVGEARKNFQKFADPNVEYNSLIYNYCPRDRKSVV